MIFYKIYCYYAVIIFTKNCVFIYNHSYYTIYLAKSQFILVASTVPSGLCFPFSFWLSTSGHYVQRFLSFLVLHFWTLCPKVSFLFSSHFWTLCPKVCFLFLALHFWTLCPKVLLSLFDTPLLDIRKTTVITMLQWLEDVSILF